jgi:hypothetical protein
MARATGELHCKSLTLEVGAMESRNNVPRIQCVLVFDEAKTTHELDLRDLA